MDNSLMLKKLILKSISFMISAGLYTVHKVLLLRIKWLLYLNGIIRMLAINGFMLLAHVQMHSLIYLSMMQIFKMNNNDKLFESKINGYLYQDKRFDVDMDQYITVKWMNECSTRCCYCNDHLDVDEITVERINDSLPHYINNCKIACLDCNRAHLNNKIE
jgi:hypothetical protein